MTPRPTLALPDDTVAAYDPHGAALLAFEGGDASATLTWGQDGERDDVPAAFWFRNAIDPLEEAAVDPGTLAREAQALGWTCEVLQSERGHFLARLVPR